MFLLLATALADDYNPIGKRDPFRDFLPSAIVRPPEGVALQRWPVSSYRLLGVVENGASHALLEDPDRGAHVVEIGTYVGDAWGKVTAIEDGRVVVTEEWMGEALHVVQKQLVLPTDEVLDFGR